MAEFEVKIKAYSKLGRVSWEILGENTEVNDIDKYINDIVHSAIVLSLPKKQTLFNSAEAGHLPASSIDAG